MFSLLTTTRIFNLDGNIFHNISYNMLKETWKHVTREIQLDLYYPWNSIIHDFLDQNLVRPSTADNRGLTVETYNKRDKNM